jgi:hypothetical protein
VNKLSDSREMEIENPRLTDRGSCHTQIWYKTDIGLRKIDTRNVMYRMEINWYRIKIKEECHAQRIDMKKERGIEREGGKTDLEFWEKNKRNAMNRVKIYLITEKEEGRREVWKKEMSRTENWFIW